MGMESERKKNRRHHPPRRSEERSTTKDGVTFAPAFFVLDSRIEGCSSRPGCLC